MQSIIKTTRLRDYPKLILRLNAEFKDLGIKEVTYQKEIREDSYFNNITLVIDPSYYMVRNNFVDMVSNTHYEKLYNKIQNLAGYNSCNSYYKIEEPREKIEVEIEGEKFEIGCYIKERNLIIIYYNLFHTNLELLFKNDLLFYFIKALKDFVKNNKVKKVDIKKVLKELTIERFCNSAKNKIVELDLKIKSKSKEIKDYEKTIVIDYREIQGSIVGIKGLNSLIKNSKKIVMEGIDEIKALPFVKKVSLSKDGIKVEVGDIFIKDLGIDYYIGEFVIYIKPEKIEIKNKKPVLNGDGHELTHPHIDTSGTICFGDRKNKVYELLGNYELKKLVYFIYLYLKSYNQADKYFSLSEYWSEHGK